MTTILCPPSYCPECGSYVQAIKTADTVKDGVVTEVGVTSHYCTNLGCKGRMTAHFIYIGKREVMDIDGLGDVIAEQFVSQDIAPSLGYLWQWGREAKTMLEADSATFDASVAEAGFSVAQVRTLLASLDKARTAPWDKWLQGLGLPGVARETAKALANHLGLGSEDLLALPDKLLGLVPQAFEGLGPITVKYLHEWALAPSAAMDLHMLYDAGVRPQSTVAIGGEGRPLEGYVLCITGEFQEDRESIQKKLESLGAVCKSGVSKKTNLLLIGDAPGKNKTSRAAELGIRTEGREWLIQALKTGGLALKDNGMPTDEDLDEDL